MYELRLLLLDQVEKIYTERMVEDFPPNELKPLDMIKKLVSEKRYDCYGLFEDDEILGYVYLNRLEGRQDYLIDFLATIPARRNSGLGAIIIKLVAEKISDADSIIGEVENPLYETNPSNKELQTRRLNFYMRNGFKDTNVRVTTFGVPFIIIELASSNSKSENEIKELYKQHYKAMLPKAMYDANIVLS